MAQLVITAIAVAVDIGVVFRGVWIPLMKATPPQDRPYLWKGIASYARQERLLEETKARIKIQEASKVARR